MSSTLYTFRKGMIATATNNTPGRIRTCDLLFRREPFCPLNYRGRGDIMSTCLACGSPTSNPKFCNNSCSSSFLNRSENGRKTGRKKGVGKPCKFCGKEVRQRKNRFCDNCSGNLTKTVTGKYIRFDKATKADILTNDTQRYRRIRNHAHYLAKKQGILDQCQICGYSTHVECAHKKAIRDFPETATIAKINALSNLVGLCRNHHWEFDHGMIAL